MNRNISKKKQYDIYEKNHLDMCKWFKKRGYDDGHFQGFRNGYCIYNFIPIIDIENKNLLCEDYTNSYNKGFTTGYSVGYKEGYDKWCYEHKCKQEQINNNIPDTSFTINNKYIEPEIMYVEHTTRQSDTDFFN
jgi:hypothetical protein